MVAMDHFFKLLDFAIATRNPIGHGLLVYPANVGAAGLLDGGGVVALMGLPLVSS